MRSADYYYYYYWHFTNCFHFFGIEVIFYGIIVENHWWYVSILTSKGPNHVLSSFLGGFLFCFLICISHTWIIRSFPGMTFPQSHIISSTNVNMRQTRATRPFFPLWLSLVYQLSIVQKSKAKNVKQEHLLWSSYEGEGSREWRIWRQGGSALAIFNFCQSFRWFGAILQRRGFMRTHEQWSC